MLNIDKIDDELYIAMYGIPKVGDVNEIWNRIKSNTEVLKDATKVVKDKFNQKDIVKGLTICSAMLMDCKSVDEVAYKELINSIYTNKDIARIVMGGASNGGNSFLLMSLWNRDLKLTEEQKAFAVNEAMNKIGTTRYEQSVQNYSKKLEENGITDDKTTIIDIDGSKNPVGEKTKAEYTNYIYSTLSNTQAHGIGAFDIRYHILRNPNWTLDEKRELIMDFWADSEDYDTCLEEWEWAIVNDDANYKEHGLPTIDKDVLLHEFSYSMLLKYYGNKDTADRIWEEISFCKQMHQLRAMQWELNNHTKKIMLNPNN